MKKSIISMLVLILMATSVFAQNMKATVISVNGKVERLAGSNWTPLQEGDVLDSGTMISTGFKSSATIKFDGSVLTLSPLSRLTLSQFVEQEGSRDSQVYLDAGKVSANIKSTDNKRVNFTVNSPVATASVRGTAGEVDVLGNIRSTESVWSVQALSTNGNAVGKVIPVSQGMTTQINENGFVSSAVSVTLSDNAGNTTLFDSVADYSSDFVASANFASDAMKNSASVSQVSNYESEPVTTSNTASLNITISF